MSETVNAGHRQRLRERFMAASDGSRTEEALLELLLTYAIPIQDVRPLAQDLIERFGSLSAVLAADPGELSQCPGVKASTTTLLKIVDWIREHYADRPANNLPPKAELPSSQPTLFDVTESQAELSPNPSGNEGGTTQNKAERPRSGIFGKSMLAEAIDMLPLLPDTDSLEEIRLFLRDNLRFSASETRRRNATYITKRMFPEGCADKALREFARKYAGRLELREACFYRFCKAEPLMFTISDELLIPAMLSARLDRSHLKDFLIHRFPGFKSVDDCATAVVDTLVAGGVAKVDKQRLTFAFRSIPDASFAFVLHSEYPEPGMYDIAQLEENQAIRALLWRPDQMLPALYELRNLDIISNVSQIDNVRQFTTKWRLDQVMQALAGPRSERVLRDGSVQPEDSDVQEDLG